MSTMELLRGFFALLFGGIVAWGIYRRYDPEMRTEAEEKPERRFAPVMAPLLLPFYLIALLAMLLMSTDSSYTLMIMGSMCLQIFLHMSLYFILLIALTPLLRRWVSARACAALWLLPNFLYFSQMSFMQRDQPRRIIALKGDWFRWALLIWLCGMAAVLLWKLVEHLVFRRRLRKSAHPAEPELQSLWRSMQQSSGLKKPKLRLYRSDALATPLSVGVFRAATFAVLPERDYAPEELELILRHELVHILRCDGQTKLFLTFCTAMCWFNPLMWLAMARAAEDLELSCDELVLEYANAAEKRRYADLVLRCAGEPRGFTSCLSATAKSLRYRLKQIVSPGRRLVGGVTVGAVFFLLLVTSGMVAFAWGSGTVQDAAFDGNAANAYSFDNVSRGVCREYGGISSRSYTCTEPDALLDYVFSLPVIRVGGNYQFPSEGEFLDLFLRGPEGSVFFSMTESYFKLNWLHGHHRGTEIFRMEEAPDWEYIDALLEEIEYDPIPQPQNLDVFFYGEDYVQDEPLISTGTILENTLNGEPSDRYSHWEATCCVIEGAPVTQAELRFSDGLLPTELTVTAQNWERTDAAVTLEVEESDNFYALELLPESAHYTAEALFIIGTDVGEQVYRMRYGFDVELPKKE